MKSTKIFIVKKSSCSSWLKFFYIPEDVDVELFYAETLPLDVKNHPNYSNSACKSPFFISMA